MKPVSRVKVGVKSEATAKEFRVWCEYCCIRIAPNEERIAARGKSYHSGCHLKLLAETEVLTKS
jgi:hypothetical protein